MRGETTAPCTCGPYGTCPPDCRNRNSGTVLGIDPGLDTGWCVYSPRGPVRFGMIDLRAADDLGARLNFFAEVLKRLIVEHRPAILAIERPFGRAAFTSDLPGTLCGVAHMVAHRLNLPRREFTASAIKKGIAGSGSAKKGQVIAAVRDRYGIPVLSDHQADAAGVAIMAWAQEAQKRGASLEDGASLAAWGFKV